MTYGSSIESERVETKRRAILAATEFLAGKKGKSGLGIADLLRKHGVKHKESVYREVTRMEQDPEILASIDQLS
eukprot:2688193-Rhodomonas_salina.1